LQSAICSIVENKHPIDLKALMNKAVTFVWELMFSRPIHQTPTMSRQHDILEASHDALL
jgi:hypothetical protein